MEKLLRKKGK